MTARILLLAVSIFLTTNVWASSCTVSGTGTKNCYGDYWNDPIGCATDQCCDWNDIDDDCEHIPCNTLTNPDICAGCDTCTTDWTVDDDRSTTPWDITCQADLILTTNGKMIIQSPRTVTVAGDVKVRDTDALKVSGTLKVGP